jgi:hypothetical protein
MGVRPGVLWRADCQIEPVDAQATAAGWLVKSTGETVGDADARIRESGDERFHRCRLAYADRSSKTRCLCVPPMGF